MELDSIRAKKDLSRFLQKQPNIYLAKVLPFYVYKKYLSIIGFYYYGVNGKERKTILNSFKYVLGDRLNKLSFCYFLFKTYNGIFNHYFEKMINAHKPLVGMMQYLNSNIAFSGKEILDGILLKNRGCVFVTGHFGAVEYLPLLLASHNYRASMILRFKTKALRDALLERTKSVDIELIDAESPKVIFKALKAVREGRILITLCDEIEQWRPSKKEHMEIFGYHAPKDRTLDLLYKRSKAPVCFGIVLRKKPGYELKIHPISDLDVNLSACENTWTLLEQYIYKHPDQWYQWPNFYQDFNRYVSHYGCYEN
jgi:Kdo2-lipid IVA lauroyltransferase/acyltransferase